MHAQMHFMYTYVLMYIYVWLALLTSMRSQEGGKLFDQLSEEDHEQMTQLIQRPSSPVATALHSRIAYVK